MKVAKAAYNLKEMPYPPQKKLLKRKEKNITPAKTNAPILKLLGQLHEEISKASLPVSADLSNDFKSIILETDQSKLSPFMRLFWEDSKNVYNLLKMLHITP